MYPDFMAMVQEARRKYTGVKATLQNLGLKYGMIYRARLRVIVEDRARLFDTPAAVQEFCREYSETRGVHRRKQLRDSLPNSGSGASVDLFSTE